MGPTQEATNVIVANIQKEWFMVNRLGTFEKKSKKSEWS